MMKSKTTTSSSWRTIAKTPVVIQSNDDDDDDMNPANSNGGGGTGGERKPWRGYVHHSRIRIKENNSNNANNNLNNNNNKMKNNKAALMKKIDETTSSDESWSEDTATLSSYPSSTEFSAEFSAVEEEDTTTMTTLAQQKRFLVANKGNRVKALEQLKEYRETKMKYQHIIQQMEIRHKGLLLFPDGRGGGGGAQGRRDYYDWIVASETAKIAHNNRYRNNNNNELLLPRVLRTHTTTNDQGNHEPCRDLDGHLIVHFLPAMIDKTIATPDVYGLSMFLYLDRKLNNSNNNNNSKEEEEEEEKKITLLMDVRPGAGWSNIKAHNQIPFIEETCRLIQTRFPGQLHKAIIYPLPLPLTCLLRSIVAGVLDADTSNKIAICSGGVSQNSPAPVAQLVKYIDSKVVAICEKERQKSFILS